MGSGSLVTRAAPCSSVKEEEPNTHAVTERKFLANRSPDRPLGGGDWTKVACRRVGEGGENLEHLEHPRPLPLLTRERKWVNKRLINFQISHFYLEREICFL